VFDLDQRPEISSVFYVQVMSPDDLHHGGNTQRTFQMAVKFHLG